MIRLRPSYVRHCFQVAFLKAVGWYIGTLLFFSVAIATTAASKWASALSLFVGMIFLAFAEGQRREAQQRRKELPRRKTLPDRDSRDLVL